MSIYSGILATDASASYVFWSAQMSLDQGGLKIVERLPTKPFFPGPSQTFGWVGPGRYAPLNIPNIFKAAGINTKWIPEVTHLLSLACLPKVNNIKKKYSTTLFEQEQKCCKKFRKNNNPNQGQRDLRGWPHLPSSFPKESRGHRGLLHLRLADCELLSPLAEGEEGGQHRQLQLPERASSSTTQVQAILTSQGSLQEAYL